VRVASNARVLRAAQGLTQEQIGERSGLGLRKVQQLESGRANPTIDTLALLAIGLGVDVSALLAPDAPPLTPRRRGAPKRRQR
jgi:transcriptional regulator with XRE-family HTH domain